MSSPRDMLKTGASLPWPDAMEAITGFAQHERHGPGHVLPAPHRLPRGGERQAGRCPRMGRGSTRREVMSVRDEFNQSCQ